MYFCLANATTWIDLWSIQHLAAGAAVANYLVDPLSGRLPPIIYGHNNPTQRSAREPILIGMLILLGLNFFLGEMLLYIAAPGAPPFWGNTLITDPVLVITGYLISIRAPALSKPAIILALIWPFIVLARC